MFSAATRDRINAYLEGFLQGLIDEQKVRSALDKKAAEQRAIKDGDFKPFHEAMLPPAVRRINAFERSFSTGLGSTFEAVAELVATEIHKEAHRNFRIPGQIPSAAVSAIGGLVAQNDSGGLPMPFPQQIALVRGVSGEDLAPRRPIADLYVVTKDDTRWFFEIKSPKPNKGQCLEVTERLLVIQAVYASQGIEVRTAYAMAYNPYGHRADYKWTYAVRHLDLQNQVLLQEEFWTLVGDDPATYSALLEIYAEVGARKEKDIVDQLAFGF